MPIFKKAIAVVSAILVFSTAGAPFADALSIREERELADEFLSAVYDHYDVIDDPVINSHINRIGSRLTNHIPPQHFGIRFHIIREDTFNAFAGPGGNIFIFSGLIEALETENELAAIMAHEIAHANLRHVQDMVERSKRTGFASMAGLVAGILVGLGGAPTAGMALSMGSMAAGQTMMLSYSRENELQADFFGLKYLSDAGYHEYGMLSALRTIRSREWFGEDEFPTYLRTHPGAAERMAILDTKFSGKDPEIVNTYEYDRMRMRTIALYGKRTGALDRLERIVRNRPEDPSAHYGYGLALAKGGNPEKSVSQLEKAVSLKPDDPVIAVALGQAHFLAGNNEKALAMLREIEGIERYGIDGIFTLGRIQMEKEDHAGAIRSFEKLLERYPGHQQSLFFLGQSLGRIGELGEAHFTLGQYHRMRGSLETASFHFDRALSETRDPEKKEEIRQRIRDLDAAIKQQRRQERETGRESQSWLIESGKFHGESPPPLGGGSKGCCVSEHF